jgi:hypothetical protein
MSAGQSNLHNELLSHKEKETAFLDLEALVKKLETTDSATGVFAESDEEWTSSLSEFHHGKESKELNEDAPIGVIRYRTKDSISPNALHDLLSGLTKEQIIDRLLHDLNFLSRFAQPEHHKYDFPPLLVEMWNMVVRGIMDLEGFIGEASYVLGIPRGFAKTTFIKLYIIHCTLFSSKTFFLIVTSVEDNGNEIIKDVMEMLSQDQFIELFGDWKSELATYKGINRVDQKVFRFLGRWVIMKSKGAMTSVRGLNILGLRPNNLIMDDMQSEENAQSPAESKRLLTWFSSTLLPAADPDGAVYIYVGNVYAYDGAIIIHLIKDPIWVSLTLGAITPDGKSLWEERHPLSKLIASYKKAKRLHRETHWLSQMMNAFDIVHDVHLDFDLIEDAFKQRFASGDKAEETVALQNYRREADSAKLRFLVVDPASQRRTADEVAIAHCTVLQTGEVVVDSLMSSRMNPKQNIYEIVALCIRYETPIVLVENVAYQETLRFWFDELKASLRADWITTIGFTPGKLSKNSRIVHSFEQLMQGDYFMTPDVQTKYFSQAKVFRPDISTNKDDRLDVVALSYTMYLKYAKKMQGLFAPHISLYYSAQRRKEEVKQHAI